MNIPARQFQIIITALLLNILFYSSTLPAADDTAALHDQFTGLTTRLSNNQFQRTLYIDSTESTSTLKGDIYAILDYSFDSVNRVLNDPEHGPANWCDVMMLHPNTKYCRASNNSNDKMLSVNIGKKSLQSLAYTYQMEFNYKTASTTNKYFRVNLNAENGPLGTKDCSIILEVIAINEKQTFLHIIYSCRYSMAGWLLMKSYLSTIGRNKVGFTINGIQPDGKPSYIGGMRGLVERNTMRYYLAIDAYMSALALPADKQLEKRLSKWISAAEQYQQQLDEMDSQEYIQMKYKEYNLRKTLK